jgi:beta-glucanase (GH16 family)
VQSTVHDKRRPPAHARVRSAPPRKVGRAIVVALAIALLGVGIWATHSLVASGGGRGGGMRAPAGYSSQQMIFDDQFSGTSLDTTKWNSYLGAQGVVWDDHGRLATPYSGPNTFTNQAAAMFGPSQVSVNHGLTLTAERNTNAYASVYPWLSGAVTTEGKFSLPTTGWYVQAKIKVPDMTQGMWPSMWFLPSKSGTPFNEIDFVQGGFIEGGGLVNQSPLGTGYFPTGQSKPVDESIPDVGFDATARYHTYGIQWKPGRSIKGFVDGKLVWTVTQAQVPGGIVAQPYEIVLSLQVATASDAAFHTLPTATSPGGAMKVAEVQAYS